MIKNVGINRPTSRYFPTKPKVDVGQCSVNSNTALGYLSGYCCEEVGTAAWRVSFVLDSFYTFQEVEAARHNVQIQDLWLKLRSSCHVGLWWCFVFE